MPSHAVMPGSCEAIQPYIRLIWSIAESGCPVRNRAWISGNDVNAYTRFVPSDTRVSLSMFGFLFGFVSVASRARREPRQRRSGVRRRRDTSQNSLAVAVLAVTHRARPRVEVRPRRRVPQVLVHGGSDTGSPRKPAIRVSGVPRRARQTCRAQKGPDVQRVVVRHFARTRQERVVAVATSAVEALREQPARIGDRRVPRVERLHEVRVVRRRVRRVAAVEDVVPARRHPPERIVEQRQGVVVDRRGRDPAVGTLVVGPDTATSPTYGSRSRFAPSCSTSFPSSDGENAPRGSTSDSRKVSMPSSFVYDAAYQ